MASSIYTLTPVSTTDLVKKKIRGPKTVTCVMAGKQVTPYDIVVHDCFSGGGVPEHLFTLEFWEDLKAVIHPDGVVVVVRLHPRSGERAKLTI